MISLVLFTTSTCPHCQPVKRMIDESIRPAFSESELTILHCEVDTDEKSRQVAREWAITGVPTVLLIKRKEGQMAEATSCLVGTDAIQRTDLVYTLNSLMGTDEQRNI